jgi:hypothetical protein
VQVPADARSWASFSSSSSSSSSAVLSCVCTCVPRGVCLVDAAPCYKGPAAHTHTQRHTGASARVRSPRICALARGAPVGCRTAQRAAAC